MIVEVGGGLRSYSAGGRELVDGYGAHEMSCSGRGQVLIPWPNRLEGGSYEFDGKHHQLPLNEPGRRRRNSRPGPMGDVERSRAGGTSRRDAASSLYPQPGYPFLLRTSIEYALSDRGLRVKTTTTNLSSERCPFGRGAHPSCDLTLGIPTIDRLFLTLPAGTVLQSDQRGLPINSKAVDGSNYDFRQSRPIGSTVLDHAFTDLQRDKGRNRLRETPRFGHRIQIWLLG